MFHQHLYVLLVCGRIVMVEIFLLTVSGESKCMTKWQFLLISNAVSIIYNDLFSYSRSEFINYLSVNYDIKELRYVRDLVVSVVRRRLRQALGPLVERKSGANVKENLLKDIYNIIHSARVLFKASQET